MKKIKELKRELDGIEYRSPIELDDYPGFLVVTGYSDDNICLNGFVEDEVPAYDGGSCQIDIHGLREKWPEGDEKDYDAAKEYFSRENIPYFEITAMWCDTDGPSWTFEVNDEISESCTMVDVETFNVMEDGEVFCEGLIIDCRELSKEPILN